MLPDCIGSYPLNKVEQLSWKKKKKIPVTRQNRINIYKIAMGGIDLFDSPVGTCIIMIKRKKW